MVTINPISLSRNVRLIFVSREDMTLQGRSMCSHHTARLYSSLVSFLCFISPFPSRGRLNFRLNFKEFDVKSNMKRFLKNFLALSAKKLKDVSMILPSINGRGRALPAQSCLYMPCLAISNFYRRWNYHAKVGNLMINSQKVYHDGPSSLVGDCLYKLLRECQMSLRGAISKLPRECQTNPFGEPYLNSLGSAKQNPFGEP